MSFVFVFQLDQLVIDSAMEKREMEHKHATIQQRVRTSVFFDASFLIFHIFSYLPSLLSICLIFSFNSSLSLSPLLLTASFHLMGDVTLFPAIKQSKQLFPLIIYETHILYNLPSSDPQFNLTRQI